MQKLLKRLLFAAITVIHVFSNIAAVSQSRNLETTGITMHPGFPITSPKTIEYSSPTVADLNNDGRMEILIGATAGCVWGWDQEGNLLSGFPLATWGSCDVKVRINGQVAVGDVNGDNVPEIVVGTSGPGTTPGQLGKTFVWRSNGKLLSRWPKEMDWSGDLASGQAEVYSVGLANVVDDGKLEILVGTSNNSSLGSGDYFPPVPNFYVYRSDGSKVYGFPTWYRRAGIYGQMSSADLTGDHHAELVVPRDHRWYNIYESDGDPIAGWPIETYIDELIVRSEPYLEYTRTSPSIGDLDNDGTPEVVLTGKARDPITLNVINSAVLVLKPDGDRKNGWETAKLGDRAPIYDSYSPSEAPALADLDQDGKLEIIVGLADGTMRAYRANGNLMWKYDFANGRKLFSSEPVVGDVNGDGKLDVVFGLYSPDGSADSYAGVYALSNWGKPLSGFPLALTKETNSEKRGVRAAPTLADIDGDCKLELLAGSWSGTVYAWDLEARYINRLLPWPTGRHDNARSGNYTTSYQTFLGKTDPAETTGIAMLSDQSAVDAATAVTGSSTETINQTEASTSFLESLGFKSFLPLMKNDKFIPISTRPEACEY